MTPTDLQARASRLHQLAAGLGADLPDHSTTQRLAYAAADLLEVLTDLVTDEDPPHGHTCPACGKEARP